MILKLYNSNVEYCIDVITFFSNLIYYVLQFIVKPNKIPIKSVTVQNVL